MIGAVQPVEKMETTELNVHHHCLVILINQILLMMNHVVLIMMMLNQKVEYMNQHYQLVYMNLTNHPPSRLMMQKRVMLLLRQSPTQNHKIMTLSKQPPNMVYKLQKKLVAEKRKALGRRITLMVRNHKYLVSVVVKKTSQALKK